MKSLIIYFSWSNNTKKLVEGVNEVFHYDTYRIERTSPYSTNYNTCAYIEAKEEWENRLLPNIKNIAVDLSQYKRILLFFPIWWYTFPMPIGTFVRDNLKNYKGEVIIFANSYTNDYQYVVNSLRDAHKLNQNLNIKEGLFNVNIEEHIKFIKELQNERI